MTAVTICLHNKFGFCKHGDKCHKEHIAEICQNDRCNVNECKKRHPKGCRYYQQYKRCKFGDFCAFSHDIPVNPVLEDLKLVAVKVSTLENEVKEKNEEIKAILRNIEKFLSSLNLPRMVASTHSTESLPSTVSASQSTIAIVTTNNPANIPTRSSSHSRENCIPQYDGQSSLIIEGETSENPSEFFKCEFCGETFSAQKLLKEHNNSHEFCCEDCQICYETQLESDLHELEVHPGTNYAETYVPHSTKILFARSKEITP